MKHDCRLRSLEVFEDDEGYLYVKDQCNINFGKEHNFRVEYCPICGEKGKRPHMDHMRIFKKTNSFTQESVTLLSELLSITVFEMNRNIELINNFIREQNIKNECFIDRDLYASQKISAFERRINTLEKNDKG